MTNQVLAAAIDAAVAAHQQGRIKEALTGYAKALEIDPEDAEINSLYGLALVHQRRFNEAGPYLEKAVAAEPEETGFRLNLLEWLEQTDSLDRALEEVEALIKLNPKEPRTFEKLGDLSIRRGKPGAASDAYQQAVALAPGHYVLIMKLARAHAAFRNFKAARGILEQALEFGPRDEAWLELYAMVLGAMGDIPALDALSREWAERAPQSAPAWRNVAQAAFEQGRHRDAIAAFEKALALGPRDADMLAVYGRLCLHGLEYELAASALDEAEMLDANHPEMLAAKGLLATYHGDFEEAERYCRRCLAVAPDTATVYTQLSRLTGGAFTEDEKKTLSALAWDRERHGEERMAAAFALGHALDHDRDFERAFKIYQHANDIAKENGRAAGIVYDPGAAQAHFDRLRTVFTGPSSAGAPTPPAQPVFILGMPRSGTTLVESLLSAHPDVFAAGERPDMQHLLNGYLSALGDAAPAQNSPVDQDWIDAYFKELPDIGEARRVTDKNPLNLEAVGLIDRLFPHAPIIHIRRNPVETGLSIFRQEFSKFWSFANDLEAIGHYYGQYTRLMMHWDEAYPGRVVTIDYETFAGDIASEGRKLAEAIGLFWDPAMDDFQKAKRPIATFSTVQAREPVSVRVGKAGDYGDRLAPLTEALAKAGIDPKTGALIA